MLVFAAITPHPLLSIPEIGRSALSKVRHTRNALHELALELYAAKPESIIIISPHTATITDAFTINQSPQLLLDFSAFGDLTERTPFTNDRGLGYKIKEANETVFPVILTDDARLDYGAAVPLVHLLGAKVKHPNLAVIPIGIGALSLKKHFDFGIAIKRQINLTNKRVAVVASGDLAPGAARSTVIQLNPAARDANMFIRQCIEQNDSESILSFESNTKFSGIQACIIRPLAVLYGVIDQSRYTPRILSAETALGIGYLTANFELN